MELAKRLFLLTLFLTLGLTLSNNEAFAQQGSGRDSLIYGYVADAETGEMLVDALVLMNHDTLLVTDATGYFQAKARPRIVLVVVQSGYEKTTYTGGLITTDSCCTFKSGDTIRLKPLMSTLNPLIVTAGKSDQILSSSPVSVSTIQPYLVRNRISVNMEEVANQVPGVYINDGQANIRGGSGWSYGTGSRVAVLLDGMPLVSAGTGQALWNYLPLENLEQMEVIKGAAGVLYGSSALNGVINIRTRTPSAKKFLEASVFSGFYDKPPKDSWRWQGDKLLSRSGGQFAWGSGTKTFQYILSGFYIRDEGYRMGEEDNRARIGIKTKHVLGATSSWGINANFQQHNNSSFLLWESYELAYTPMDYAVTFNRSTRANIDPYLSISRSKWKHLVQSRLLFAGNDIESRDAVDQDNSFTSAYVEYKADALHFAGKKLTLTGGLVALYGFSRAEMFQGQKENVNAAAYVRAEKTWKKLLLEGGLRYEYYRLESYEEARPVFSAGLNYELFKATWLRASYGQGYRFPVVSEAFIRTQAGPVTVYPNQDLKSETGDNYEIGLRQGFRKGDLSMYADVAVFRMRYDNMMEFAFGNWGTSMFQFGFRSVNIGKTTIDGMELGLGAERKLKKLKIHFMGGYTLSKPLIDDPLAVYIRDSLGTALTYRTTSSDTGSSAILLKYRPRHLVKADLQLEWLRFGFGMTYRYNSRIENVDGIFQYIIPNVKEARMANDKGDHIVDLRLHYQVNRHFKLRFTVNNLFNEEYMNRPADMRPPRMYSLQLAYTL